VHHTLVLPTFTDLAPAVRSYLYWRLLDVWRLEQLQACGAINSLPGCQQLVVDHAAQTIGYADADVAPHYATLLPMTVLGDGNCLLHACSVALWGIQDRPLGNPSATPGTMRAALSAFTRSPVPKNVFYERWRQQTSKWDAEFGIEEREEEDMRRDFEEELARAGVPGSYLAEIHIYVLAHVLRRPIIVFADAVQQGQRCNMRGIYLPAEWNGHRPCERAPILLAYESNHFVPLVYHLTAQGPLLPLASRVGSVVEPLPLVFASAPGAGGAASPAQMLRDALPMSGEEDGVRMDLDRLCEEALQRLERRVGRGGGGKSGEGGGGGCGEGVRAGDFGGERGHRPGRAAKVQEFVLPILRKWLQDAEDEVGRGRSKNARLDAGREVGAETGWAQGGEGGSGGDRDGDGGGGSMQALGSYDTLLRRYLAAQGEGQHEQV
jgi:hypothetical protein